jgi:hypothetical protein
MNPAINLDFESLNKLYKSITKNSRTAKFRVRKEFGLFITDSKIVMYLMDEYNRSSKALELMGLSTYPDQEIVANLHLQMKRSSVDVLAHLYKCRNA